MISLRTLLTCGLAACAPAAPSTSAPVAVVTAAPPLPTVEAPAATVAPAEPVSSAPPVTTSEPPPPVIDAGADAADDRISCKTEDDCWIKGDTTAAKPIRRPTWLRGKKFRPCVDGEARPICASGFCSTLGYGC